MTVPINRLDEIVSAALDIRLTQSTNRPELFEKISAELLKRKGQMADVIEIILRQKQEEPEYRRTDIIKILLDYVSPSGERDFELENELRALLHAAEREHETESDMFARLSLADALELARVRGYKITQSGDTFTISKTGKKGDKWFLRKESPRLDVKKKDGPYR